MNKTNRARKERRTTNLKGHGFEFYKDFLESFLALLKEKFGNRLLSFVLYDKDNFFAKRLNAVEKRLRELGSKRIRLEDGTWYWDLKPDLKSGEVFTL